MATFCLPVTYGQSGIKVKFGLSGSGAFPTIARWIVSVMGGEGNSTQVILKKMSLSFYWSCIFRIFTEHYFEISTQLNVLHSAFLK